MFKERMAFLFTLSALIFGVFSGSQASPAAQAGIPNAPQALFNNTFTYQGSLRDATGLLTGVYDFVFKLYDNATIGSGTLIDTVTADNVQVADGLFTVELNFDAANSFDGNQRWLQIEVRPDGSGVYTVLSPRQKLNASPHNVYSLNADKLDGLSSADFVEISGDTMTGRLSIDPDTTSAAMRLFGGPIITETSLDNKWNLSTTNSGGATLGIIGADGDTGVGLGFIVGDNVASPVFWMYNSSGRNAFTVARKGYAGTGNDLTTIDSYLVPLLQVRESGATGIGTVSPQAHLEIVQDVGLSELMLREPDAGGAANLFLANTVRTWEVGADASPDAFFIQLQGGAQNTFVITPSGNIGIGTQTPAQKLDVNGVAKANVIQIAGGSDLAEPFVIHSDLPLKPGLVVAIDPTHPGELTLSTQAYDKRVAGCLSGAGGLQPGLVMQQGELSGSNVFPVALSGRVYCWADASFGAIQPGDLLTTSATPGHLQLLSDPAQAFGAVIGKAMSGLESGLGLVLVLVSLQ